MGLSLILFFGVLFWGPRIGENMQCARMGVKAVEVYPIGYKLYLTGSFHGNNIKREILKIFLYMNLIFRRVGGTVLVKYNRKDFSLSD